MTRKGVGGQPSFGFISLLIRDKSHNYAFLIIELDVKNLIGRDCCDLIDFFDLLGLRVHKVGNISH